MFLGPVQYKPDDLRSVPGSRVEMEEGTGSTETSSDLHTPWYMQAPTRAHNNE